MRKGHLVKRKHSPQKDNVNSSSSEEGGKMTLLKKNSPQGKKAKERTSPATSEDEKNKCMDQCSEIDISHSKDDLNCRDTDAVKEVTFANSAAVNTTKPSSDQEEQDTNISKITEKSEKQLVSSIKDKMNISHSKNAKPMKNLYLFDFLGEEVSNDESQALQALNAFWVSTVARNKNVLKRPPPKNQQERDFYSKYCDKQGKLSVTAATRLMRLPHVITVCLKTRAQIEVIVSNRQKALEESEELREEFFEVVEAMAMHLI